MIYFIQIRVGNNSARGPIKIGYSRSMQGVKQRLKHLQTGSAWPLRLLGTKDGDEQEESRLHQLFAQFRMEGEWFKPKPALVQTIQKEMVATPLRSHKVRLLPRVQPPPPPPPPPPSLSPRRRRATRVWPSPGLAERFPHLERILNRGILATSMDGAVIQDATYPLDLVEISQ